MILPKFIAIRAYLESSGIAFADKEYINPLFDIIVKEGSITAKQGREILGHKTNTTTNLFRLYEHIGIITKSLNDDKESNYSLSNIGKELLKNQKGERKYIQPFTPFFLNWLPFKIFLKYLNEFPNATTDEINSVLGEQVKRQTFDLNKIIPLKNVYNKGITKPFNKFVIENSLAKIGEYLELVVGDKRDGFFSLTPMGKYVANSIDIRNYNFKTLEKSFEYNKLALLDFIEKKVDNIVIITKEDNLTNFQIFLKSFKQSLDFDYRISNFEAIITKNNAYWTISKNLFGLSYDPLKVLELNANIANII